MKRFIVETVTKEKMYALFKYLERGNVSYEISKPFSLSDLNRTPLESSVQANYCVTKNLRHYLYTIDVSDFNVWATTRYLDIKLSIFSLQLVLEVEDSGIFTLLLEEKKEDEDEFRQKLVVFTSLENTYNVLNLEREKIQAYFEFSADRTEEID